MRLSPTAIFKYETCPQQYYLEKVQQIRPVHTAANLLFGRVIHAVVEHWLRQWLVGQRFDASAYFDQCWRQGIESGGIEYSATQSPESLTETGQHLVAQFAQVWPSFGLMPALDTQGEPLLERKLEVELAPGIVYVGRLDLLAIDQAGTLACLDFKTPSSATDPGWLSASDQLTGYQLLLDAHAERLGISPVARIGLLELIKRKVPKRQGKGPEVCAPVTVARRTADELNAYRQKCLWVAEDIQRGRFPKRGLMAHNSPCGMCALKGLCQDGDVEGVVFPSESPMAKAA